MPSEDPIVHSIVKQIRAQQFGRRQLLRGGAFGAALLGAGALSACSSGPQYGDGTGGKLRWANWTYYIDFDDETGDMPSLIDFMEQTNIEVEYYEDIDDNKTFIAKIKDQLKLNQDTGYDLFCLTDSSAVRLFEQDQLQPFDRSKLPNVDSKMIDMVKHASFDPDREYTIPYQAGMTGLCYNTKLYPKGVKSVSDLWAPDLKGRINLLSEQDDTIGLLMLENGVDVTGDWGDDEFNAGLEIVAKQLGSGQVFNVKGNSYTQDLQKGDVLAGMCWSGDIAMLNEEEGEEVWKFVVPDAGATLFIDSFSMPNATEAVEQSHKLIDYFYEPEVAALVAEYVQYVTPVQGAREAMAAINPELAENTLIFPDDEMAAKVHDMRSLTSAEDNKYAQAYQRVLGN